MDSPDSRTSRSRPRELELTGRRRLERSGDGRVELTGLQVPEARARRRLSVPRPAVALLAILVAAVAGAIGVWQAAPLQASNGGFVGVLRRGAGSPLARLPPPPLAPTVSLARGARLSARLGRAAANAAHELAGSGDHSAVGWDPGSGLWTREYRPIGVARGWRAPWWWQSALALGSLTRYLTQTRDDAPFYRALIADTYAAGVRMPGTDSPHDFANQFMDDTAWWGIAWLQAARYELVVVHDVATARRYLAVAEWDARHIERSPRACGGIEWQVRYPTDTITNAEFISLTARLAQVLDGPGPLHDPVAARGWLSDGTRALAWLERSGLIHPGRGTVADAMTARCRVVGGPVDYTEGEVADALVQIGRASGEFVYLDQAAAFINRVLDPSLGMLGGGILQQPCESANGLCAQNPHAYDSAAYKGLFVASVLDWSQATGATTYDGFLEQQASAVLANSAGNGFVRSSCATPERCQLGFYWSRRVPPSRLPILDTAGTQESGLTALTAGAWAAAAASPHATL